MTSASSCSGPKGLLQAQNMLENTVVKSTTAGVTGAKPTYFFLERYMPAYAAEWAAFVDGGRMRGGPARHPRRRRRRTRHGRGRNAVRQDRAAGDIWPAFWAD